MDHPLWKLVVATFLASVLLADATLGQTFTYSRGWKPGGKRSRPPPPRALLQGPAARYAEDVSADDQTPFHYFVEALADHWPPSDLTPWRSQDDPDREAARDARDAVRDPPPERFRHGELTTRGDHDDH